MLRSALLGVFLALVALLTVLPAGCKSPAQHRQEADEAAAKIIDQKQKEALGHTEPFTIETPADTLRRRLIEAQNLPISGPASLGARALKPIEHFPKDAFPETPAPTTMPTAAPATQPIVLTLAEALQIGARNSREYQTRKESIFVSALNLDLTRDEFRNTFTGMMTGTISTDLGGDDPVTGVTATPNVGVTRRLQSGAVITGRLAIDLVKLLTQDRSSTLGITGDASIAFPLLRGAGKWIVTEPLTQAERDVIYQIYSFEEYKRTFAVSVASQYFGVLQQLDRIKNQEESYRSVILSTRQARRLSDAGLRDMLELDQSLTSELSARDRWIGEQENYRQQLDALKVTLGLPADAELRLEPTELERAAAVVEGRLPARPASTQPAGEVPPMDSPVELIPASTEGGPLEISYETAIRIALENRLDLRTAQGDVYDAQRQVAIAANNLGTGLDFVGRASMGEGRSLGSAGLPSGELRPEKGYYSAGLELDLPLERTSERNAYRTSLINLERAVRSVQDLEDRIKLDIRSSLRVLRAARESLVIQAQAVVVAERQVGSATLLFEAGRGTMRDRLDAQNARLAARNLLTAAQIDYRLAELELQRDMGVLQVNEEGLWQEIDPKRLKP